MRSDPVRAASLGMGWWSDVLADAIQRSDNIEIAACFTRSPEKRAAFAEKYGCKSAESYEEILGDPSIEAIINTTPNHVHLDTTRAAAAAGKHIFLDKPVANSIADGKEIARICDEAGVIAAIGYQVVGVPPGAGTGARYYDPCALAWIVRNVCCRPVRTRSPS